MRAAGAEKEEGGECLKREERRGPPYLHDHENAVLRGVVDDLEK